MLVTSCRTKHLQCIIWSSTWWNGYRYAGESEQYRSSRTDCPTSWATTTASPYCFRTATKKLSGSCQVSWCISRRLNTCCSTANCCSATHTSFLNSTHSSHCLESFIYSFKCIWDVEEISIPTFLWSRCLTLAWGPLPSTQHQQYAVNSSKRCSRRCWL